MGVSTSSGKLRSYWLCVPGVSMKAGYWWSTNQVLVVGFCLWVPSLGTAGCHTISYPLCVPGVSIKAGDWWSTRYKTSHHHLFGLQASSCTAGVQSNKILQWSYLKIPPSYQSETI